MKELILVALTSSLLLAGNTTVKVEQDERSIKREAKLQEKELARAKTEIQREEKLASLDASLKEKAKKRAEKK